MRLVLALKGAFRRGAVVCGWDLSRHPNNLRMLGASGELLPNIYRFLTGALVLWYLVLQSNAAACCEAISYLSGYCNTAGRQTVGSGHSS
jgi:hypothetical protein